MRTGRANAFSLVEILVVVLIVATMAVLTMPLLASALTPPPDHFAAMLEADFKRARLAAMGRLRPMLVVVGSERDRWWIQLEGEPTPEDALRNSMRTFGAGTLGPFEGYRLAIRVGGADIADGNVTIATFDLEGNRDAAELRIELQAPGADAAGGTWTVRPERTRLN